MTTHHGLPPRFKQEQPTATNMSNLPYTQLLQMHAAREPNTAGLYRREPAIREFGVPTGSSMDSGYEEMDPFEKPSQYHIANDMNFDQTCSTNQHDMSSTDFGAYGYGHQAIVQGNPCEYSAYPISEITTVFEPLLDHSDPFRFYPASPGLEEASDDGRTASVSNDSPPQQAVYGTETSPRPQQGWPHRSESLKQRAVEGEVEAKYTSEERPAPKAAPSRGRPRKRIPHTAVERRYRENLNSHLERLRGAVPNLTAAQRRKSTDGSDPMKPSKCEILMGAFEYIKRLEAENDSLKREFGG